MHVICNLFFLKIILLSWTVSDFASVHFVVFCLNELVCGLYGHMIKCF